MTRPLLLIRLTLAVLVSAEVLAQAPVSIQFQTDPVLVQTGAGVVFTVLTVPQVLSMTWQYKGVTVGVWTNGAVVINPSTQFTGRVTITATQLQIGNVQLQDAGNYTVTVAPSGSSAQVNSKSVQLEVFDAVTGVSVVVPSVAIEGRNVSLSCTWTAGTDVTVQWGKDGAAVTASSRITVTGASLVINPAQRGDAGTYTCTASNPASAQSASRTLTVYYGPDTPVLTKETPNQNGNACVGGGDVVVGQTVGFTCTSSSLPPALFSWQYNGQPVTSSQSASGVLTLQTYSTNQSGQYFCTARNSISGNTSTQGTVLAVVGTCITVGQVVGIVIGSLVILVIIVLLIVLIVFLVRRRRAPPSEGAAVVVQKTNPQSRPPDPQPNGARDLGQGPEPPLYTTRHPERDTTRPGQGGEPQTLQNTDTRQHNGYMDTNGLLNNPIQTSNNRTDNPAFVHTHNPNTQQQQNPNIVIQTGTGQDGARLPAVHVNLTTLPQAAQQNGNGQMPTIHVNLTSLPSSGQTQQDTSLPPTNTAYNHASPNPINTQQSNPREQSRQLYPSDHRLNGHVATGNQLQPGLIPTGYTGNNSNSPSQRNANTQTYQQDTHRSRSDRTSGRHDATVNPSRQQMSWDLLRGTPAYPSGTLQRRQVSPEDTSDSTDYTTTDYTSHPPTREALTNVTQPHPLGQTTSRSRTPTRRDEPSVHRQTRSRSTDSLNPNRSSVAPSEAAVRTQRHHNTQRERAQRDIRGLSSSQTAPRQETTHSSNPQARPPTSQQASVARSAVSQGPTAQQGLNSPRGTDTRALADPNHLPQTHVAQEHRAVETTSPQGLGTQTQPVTQNARQPFQGAPGPIPQPSAQANPSNLTQAALEAHAQRAQTFTSRRQQTQAALLHPGPQAPVPKVQHPPTPPPVIPLTQFQTLPKEGEQHRSPTRVPQPSRRRQHHAATMAAAHHHHPGRGHVHVSANRNHHATGHGHPDHFTHHQQQARRGRPR